MTSSLLDKLKLHHSDSYGWALACCQWETSLAEDVLQEAYLRALDGRARFSGQASEKTWFFAVIKRVAADIYRTRKRHSILNLRFFHTVQEAANEPDEQDSPYQHTHEQQGSEQLRAALCALPQRQREVLHLVFYADLTLEEAALTLGIQLGSVRTHYHRGKNRLAQLLKLEDGVQDAR